MTDSLRIHEIEVGAVFAIKVFLWWNSAVLWDLNTKQVRCELLDAIRSIRLS